jgi:Putative zinc-binding metallo-peptidase
MGAAGAENSKPVRASRGLSRLSDDALLQMRFCDLPIRLVGSDLEQRLQRVYGELEHRGIRFRPHMWLAEEWFSPDGVPGIAVPFYLAHPRLIRLERRMMKQVEGGNAKWMMRILRHEVGHALDSAYRLRRRAQWRAIFGPASLRYPEHYRARPGSRRFVQHLGDWYAQSHPTEDFAETFAVWLKPNSDWRRTYASWPAWEKLQYVDHAMREVADKPAAVRCRAHIESLRDNTRTLAEHYREKQARQTDWHSEAIDGLILRMFARRPARRTAAPAARFLRGHRRQLLASTQRSGMADAYTLHQVLRLAVERTNSMRLYLRGSQRDALPHARWLLASIAKVLNQRERPQMNL